MKTILLVLALGIVAISRPEGLHSAPTAMGAHCLMPRPMLMAQEGNPGHKQPPPGWHCAAGKGDDKDKPCACHRECVVDDGEDEQGNQTHTTRLKEDPKCDAWCFADHCACGVHNCE